MAKGSAKAFAKLSKDPLYALIKSMRNAYFDRVAAGYGAASAELDSLTGVYTNGLRTLFPERAFFGCEQHLAPDLRKVKGHRLTMA